MDVQQLFRIHGCCEVDLAYALSLPSSLADIDWRKMYNDQSRLWNVYCDNNLVLVLSAIQRSFSKLDIVIWKDLLLMLDLVSCYVLANRHIRKFAATRTMLITRDSKTSLPELDDAAGRSLQQIGLGITELQPDWSFPEVFNKTIDIMDLEIVDRRPIFKENLTQAFVHSELRLPSIDSLSLTGEVHATLSSPCVPLSQVTILQELCVDISLYERVLRHLGSLKCLAADFMGR